MSKVQFTHLHLHTEYSMLDGANKIPVLAKKIKELGMDAVAMTDHGNMFGTITFYNEMKKNGIKPIIGMEAYIHNKEDIGDKSTRKRFHLCLYAKNDIGYKNLMYLSSQAYMHGFYYYPRINWKMLKENAEGLICSSACLQGEINWHLNLSERNIKNGAKGYEEAKRVALRYKEVFGDDFYMEIMRHGIDHQYNIDKQIIRLSQETGIKIIATNDTHYTLKEDADAHEAFMCIAMNKLYDDPNRLRHSVHEFYIKSPEEMAKLFADIPEAISNTQEIVDKCNLEIKLGNPTPPNFKFAQQVAKEEGLTLPSSDEYSLENDIILFNHLSKKGLEKRLKIVPKEKHQEYRDRLQVEMDIINNMKFPGYMLIVWEFVIQAKKMGIPVGPGRGCLTKDALVYTLNKNRIETIHINNIKVGDRVLTHNNTPKKVTECFEYDIEEELLTISTFYGDFINNITLTKDHKIYMGNNEWKEAQEITTKDWLVMPIPKYRIKKVREFDLLKFYNKDYIEEDEYLIYTYSQNKKHDFSIKDLSKRVPKTKATIKKYYNYLIGKDVNIKEKTIKDIENYILTKFNSTNDWVTYISELNQRKVKRYLQNSYYFRKFLGRWIGDGHIRKDMKRKSVSVVFHKDDKHGVDETLAFIEENGYDYSLLKTKNIIDINIHDKFLHAFFAKTFSDYRFESNSKYIPSFVFSLPKQEILEVLDGYISADGYTSKDRIKIATVSKTLAMQTRKLLFQIGIPSTIREDKRVHTSIQLKEGNTCYTINFPSNGSIYNIPKERQNIYKIEKDFIKLKVRKVTKHKKQKTKVYDFTVEDDHSYTTSNYIVHNSAAGSLVAYSLEITDIDPIPYGLLFERFLNPERVSMPDIDMDFCQARRQEILDYVIDKYGRVNVAQIITFGKLQAKGVIRDVARVLDMPYSQADAMAKLIPDELGINLTDSYAKEPKIEELCKTNPLAKRTWNYALALEGLNRNAGTHAAGVVISNEPLWKKTPLFKPTGQDTIATQYNGKYVEDVDLIKFDFLGLKTLTVIEEANKLVEIRHGKRIDFIKEDVNDKGVYEYISTGDTLGLFQIESAGMQDLAKKLKPDGFEDIIAMLALYRPGPMESGMLDDFVERKHGRAKITYMFPELEPILKPTYGVIVYQEQVMQIVQTIGGFSLGGADLVRRAMGKKIKEEMDRLKTQFADGASEKGFDRKKSEELFDLIVKFAGYGFNKSHSAAYAMVTFYTSFLKRYYPTEFMAAILTLEKNNTDKVVKYVDELKNLNIELRPPNINRSLLVFQADEIDGKKVVFFGMGAIKGAGDVAIKSIIKSREDGGDFKDMSDFLSRIDASKVNKRVVESLIKSGGFDDFGHSRQALLSQIEDIVETAKRAGEARKMALGSLFGDTEEMTSVKITISDMPEYDLLEILDMEKESLGFYVSGHPLDKYREQLEGINYTLSSEIEDLADGSQALFIGKIENITTRISKKGNKFGIANIMDLHGNIELMLFENRLKELEEDFNLDKPIAFKVKITKDGDFTRMNILKIESLKDAKKEKVKIKKEEKFIPEEILPTLSLTINLMPDVSVIEELYCLAQKHQGKHPLELRIKSKLSDVIIESKLKVNQMIIEEAKEIGIYLEEKVV
ncbi:DNA polymerase III alpha subunit [hydrothermal vent metagenome]|uniref:DNA-directed DNA polymerase n=1 Tax=hydrothermal vent metagenome TaxID=652676 RepID=A0A1W1CES4_9ZZZZ